MSQPELTLVTRLQGNNAALLGGSVTPQGFTLQFEEVPVLVHAFRRMVRQLEFDICEMALTTYLCAREHGVKFTALPVFLVRAFHHGAIFYNADIP
ncbi:MAG: ABC transporter substrate-binding protein, partial [Proteobacteria bacterium]|nr:ABC transporter substrate-binding protein [Pseudomonadota bacterium]